MSTFKLADRQTGYLMPPSVNEWLPEGHLARFIVDIIENLDLTAFTDGTKIQANASKHSALSYGHITQLESQFKAEVQELLALAAQADTAVIPDGMDLPQELRIREQRLAVMAKAKTEIEARAAVDGATMLVVVSHVSQAPNDKQQVEPIPGKLAELPDVLGTVKSLNPDTGYCSENNILKTEAAGIEPFIAVSRQEHHPDWQARHTEPPPLAEEAGTLQNAALIG